MEKGAEERILMVLKVLLEKDGSEVAAQGHNNRNHKKEFSAYLKRKTGPIRHYNKSTHT